jgi:uncharacterized membrane protein YidH (DUF202 family)
MMDPMTDPRRLGSIPQMEAERARERRLEAWDRTVAALTLFALAFAGAGLGLTAILALVEVL